ncbi:hypothetical protein RIVM261_077360 [Rivularia sp. IAM M-261]|nr:hypothetical protein RIVM261_077360 [Rivularia sp. IAM M-261]
MGKVISLEHPELNCVRIDLDPEQSLEASAKALFNEIWSEDNEDQVAWRGDSRYVPRLVPSHHQQTVTQTGQLASYDANSQKSLSFRSDATYIITGGLAGLGLLVARWMVSKGAKNLVLVGRGSPNETAAFEIMELEMAGAAVVVEKADVSNVTDMARVLHNIENSNIPLAGIIHSAGMLSDGVLANQTWSSFEKVMAAKVQGAWHLHQLTQNQPLEFFVLFSSAASLLGSSGQANHSAANAFLDGLAHYRQVMGLPGLSINWGAISQVGEAAERGADKRAEKRAMGAISPHEFSEALELLMTNSSGSVGVIPIYWSEFIKQSSIPPFFTHFREIYSKSSLTQSTLKAKPHQLFERLEVVSPMEREKLLTNYLQGEVIQVLGISASQIDVQQPLNTMGVDSLMAVELRNRLKTDLGVDVPVVKFIEDICVASLATEVNERITQIDKNQRVEAENIGQLYQNNVKENDRIRGEL